MLKTQDARRFSLDPSAAAHRHRQSQSRVLASANRKPDLLKINSLIHAY